MSYFRRVAVVVGVLATLTTQALPSLAFVAFESGPVRPLAKSPDGARLFVCNTPDNRLEIFDITMAGLTKVASVPVGLEPVAVAARSNTEVWVVNHLSDSVSVVDISDIAAPRVTRSLTVGDEPRDIVFGGTSFNRAFITTAHRGQNIGFNPQLTTAGVGRADVWVFDADDLGNSFGGNEETVITLFGDTPRPLAVSADGSRVYAGVFFSGNQTTVLAEGSVPNGGEGAGGLPDPATNHSGVPRPEVGLIVKYNGSQWVDELSRDWSGSVRFNLPDYDVFAIDATANPPIQLAGTPGRFPHVGTTLFNMAINPADGKLFVSNLEAFNEVRFEGPGEFADTTVRGHLVESRITIIDPLTETVTPRHLNKHIDYMSAFDPTPNATNDKSLAFPLDMAFDATGSKLYVTAFGSSKIGVYTPSAIADDSFVPDAASQIEVSGGGPSGIVLDEANARAFVLTRFNNSVAIVNTTMNVESDSVPLHNPEPASVVEGRPFLYDARRTSARGDQACASCHIFGDFDALAWDLGNPDDDVLNNPSPLTIFIPPPGPDPDFHPMKGPMTTQSLRGMDNHGPMHWRGDRTNGNEDPVDSQPNRGIFNEDVAFRKFNPAFVGLLGRSEELAPEEMQSFTDFILQVMYPPNPVRALDNSLTPSQAAAETMYFNRTIDTVFVCNGCHVFDRNANGLGENAVARPGFFGTDGRSSFEGETQYFKIAHLRNLYTKVGMFGNGPDTFVNPGDNGHKGDQVRGFGFLHDGSVDTVFRFFQATVFNPSVLNTGFITNAERRDMEQLMLAFDSNHRSVVGQQVTLSPTSNTGADNRVDLLIVRADAGECDVVVKGVVGGDERGWLYEGSHEFSSDRAADGFIDEASLRALADTPGQELTFTAVPTGEGERIGIDRDLDGYGDADEVDGAGDPADAESFPCATTSPAFPFGRAVLTERHGRLQLRADVILAAPYTGGIVAVSAIDVGGTILAKVVPNGAFTVNSRGTAYKYKAPKGSDGLVRVTVKKRNAPNEYRVVLKADAAWAPPAADETIATTSVTLHVTDECFEGAATRIN